ncbi:MAG: transposase [Magnetococcales bacterium]|nr:transposase [Magnetococcales bacterium]
MTNSEESGGSGSPWMVLWFKLRFGKKNLAEEGLGRNPTDRGRSGCKLHLHVDQDGIPLGIELVGANVHDSRLIGSTLNLMAIDRPIPTQDQPQNLCSDKGYDYARVDRKMIIHGYQPHIRRIGEEKLDVNQEKKHPAAIIIFRKCRAKQ